MPTLGAALDFAQLEGRQLRAHQLGSAPSSPVTGQLYYNTGNNTLFWWDGTAWQSAKGGVPSAHASTHQPGGADPMAVDQAAGTGSLRTLCTGATQAAAGNDARFTDARAPSGNAGGDLTGTYPNPTIGTGKVTSTHILDGTITHTDVAAANKDGANATPSMRTLGYGANVAMPGSADLATIALQLATSGVVGMNSNRIVSLADPTGAQDAATKNYVDNAAQGLDAKASVKVATTANIASLASAPGTIDGVTLGNGDRVLVKDQTTQSQNGIYVFATPGDLTLRAPDANAWAELPSAFTFVEQGTVNADTGWVCTADQGGTLGTTNVTWVQFASAGQAIAGAGLTKSGNTLDVNVGSGLMIGGDQVMVSPDGITNSMIADGAINLGGADVFGTLPLSKGGTGGANAAGARSSLGAAGYYSNATHGAGTTITITQATHGLAASRGLVVQCQIDATGAVVLPDVVVASNGDVTITFGASQGANTIRTTIIG